MARKLSGCKMLHYAPVTIDGDTATFGEIVKIPDIEEYSYTFLYAEASNYADNQQNIYMKKITGADMSLVLSDLSIKTESDLMGKKSAKGGAVTNTNDQQKSVAILWEETYSDGTAVRNVLYNTKVSKDETSGKTEGENVEFTAVNLVGKSIPLPNGDIHYKLDSADKECDKTKFDAWFTEVQIFTESESPAKEVKESVKTTKEVVKEADLVVK